ncbi:MAG TPA: PQQ-dependent sugar dehydrogenase [Flavobacteriales bacterium]|nr:PQQ-dependent sugar dehydrogenase [Flavobacteriales bacterium]
MLRPIALACLAVATATHAQTTFLVGTTEVTVEEMATGLEVPWDLVLGPDGYIWFTQANGEVHRMDAQDGTLELVHTLPDVFEFGFTAGLHSMAFHPDFSNEPYVYLHYTISSTESVVKRFLYDAGTNSFTNASDHLLSLTLAAGPSHNGSRIIVDDAGMFLLCLGETMSNVENAQNPATSHGKVLRFAPDGSIPADNPVPGSYVYNWGHRNPQGMVKASNGFIYNSAHGQANDDEVNILLPNRNYGWPEVLGLCNTPDEIAYCEANDVVEPIHEFTDEVVAPAGIDYFDHPSIPGWQNSLLVATLRGKELRQLQLNATGDAVVADNTFLSNTFGRLRDVLVHPDGRVFLCTSNRDWAGSPVAADDRILVLSGDGTVRIPEQAPVPFRLFLDAASGTVWLSPSMQRVMVFDAAGRVVAQPSVVDDRFSVNGWPNGLYTVRSIDREGRSATAQLVLVRVL